jgi:oxygen-dependent protoporphyrinogen oxidase
VEGLNILGCTFTHVKWPGRAPEGVALLRAFFGERGLRDRDQGALLSLVREDFRKLLGITAAPRFVKSWIGRKVMPQYPVGHLERVAEMERRAALLPNLALAGNGYRGVGIPDSIHSGEQAVERLLAS